MSEAPALRIVPGAPPPAPLTKSQKKKRRALKGDEHDVDSPITNGRGLDSALDSALTETAPATGDLNPALVSKPEDVANAAIASEIAADLLTPTGLLQLSSKKTSAVVELVNKRHRTLHKKIQRIKEYSSKPVATLNEDQKRTLATLPQLEASSREVEEVRKAIEVHEAEEAANEHRRLAEIEAIVKQRIADAVSESRTSLTSRTVQLVMVLGALSQLHTVAASEEDNAAIAEVTAALQSGDQTQVESTVGLFLAGQGGYSKLVALLEASQHPPSRTATPAAEEEVAEEPRVTESAIKGIPSTSNMTGSYHFMQESELEPSTPFDEGAEWVEHPEATTVLHDAPEAEPTAESSPSKAEGHIDWAAEDHEDALPSITGLQEQFGTSGQATPVMETPATDFPTDNSGGWGDAPDTSKPTKQEESDGFTTIPSKRGAGAGGDWRGGDRGRGRGGYRGGRGGNSDWRGGYGSGGEGHSGRGSYRGGGGGGGDRGRGEYRGRARGEWRGESRGEWRGRGGGGGDRGRGEGREGRGGYRGRPPPPAEAQ